ncbi:S49 family peptidase [Marinicauda salina]
MHGLQARLPNRPKIIPVVRLEGMIAPGGRAQTGNAVTLAKIEPLLERAFAFKPAPAVVILVNSPGGSPVQSKLIHDRIRHLAEEKNKPVLVFCEDVAASGGYMIACAGDEIFCDASTLLGSIGVVSANFGFTEAMERLGVERRMRTAGKKKALGDPFSPETKDQQAQIDRITRSLHEGFIGLVKTRRGDKLAKDPDLFSGAVFTGLESVENGLVDGMADMRAELKTRYGATARVRMLAPAKAGPFGRMFGGAAAHFAAELDARAAWSRYDL